MIDNPGSFIVFTDGSSRGNPGPGGWGAVVVYPDDKSKVESEKSKVVEIGGGEEYTTNNRMELQAVIKALTFIHKSLSINHKSIFVFSDSSYLVKGITQWIHGWQKNNWLTKAKTPVENKDLWEKLFELSRDKKIEWRLVGGHIGVSGNERCDEIAAQFADKIKPELYNGSFEEYPIKNILDTKIDNHKEVKKSDNRSHSRAKAYSYVSLANGVIKIDKTWIECEARVKGVRGAKYKKSVSMDNEKEIIDSFKTF